MDSFRRAAWIALAAAASSSPTLVLAESLASSAASSASSTASSASQSLESASASSRRNGQQAAAGDYRIEAVTAANDRPGRVRVTLAPLQPNEQRQPFVLVLPHGVAEQQALARGDTVSARARAYGLEFARADRRQAFFLVLTDDWHRELDAQPLAAAL
jgi:hypothetical protein